MEDGVVVGEDGLVDVEVVVVDEGEDQGGVGRMFPSFFSFATNLELKLREEIFLW